MDPIAPLTTGPFVQALWTLAIGPVVPWVTIIPIWVAIERGPAGVSRRTPLPAERGPSVRRNLRLFAGLRPRIRAGAKARGLQDRQMVEEW
jgi:hypothetical protein